MVVNANLTFLIFLLILNTCTIYNSYKMSTYLTTDLNFKSNLFYAKITLIALLLSIIVYIVFVTKIIVYDFRKKSIFITCFATAFLTCLGLFVCVNISTKSGQINPVTNTEIEINVDQFSFALKMIIFVQVLSFMFFAYELYQEIYNPSTQKNLYKAQQSLNIVNNYLKQSKMKSDRDKSLYSHIETLRKDIQQ